MTFHLQLDQTNKLNLSSLILKIKWLDLRAPTILSYRFSSIMGPSLSRITTVPAMFVLVVLISPLLESDVHTSYQQIFLCSFLLILKPFQSISAYLYTYLSPRAERWNFPPGGEMNILTFLYEILNVFIL